MSRHTEEPDDLHTEVAQELARSRELSEEADELCARIAVLVARGQELQKQILHRAKGLETTRRGGNGQG